MSELVYESGESSVAVSRFEAVGRIFTGGLASLLGGGMAVAASTGMAAGWALPVALLGTVVGGFGLLRIGSAATHLLRYGRTTSGLTLAATGALGALVASWPFLIGAQWLGVWQAPMWFRQLFGMSVATTALVVVLLTLAGMLLRGAESESELGS